MVAMKEVLARFDMTVTGQQALSQADKAVKGTTSSVSALTKLLAGGALLVAGKSLFGFVDRVADAADQQDKFAQAIGTSAKEVAIWEKTLGDAGVSVQQARLGLKTFAKQAGESARGNKDLRKTLRELGASTKDARGEVRPFSAVLEDAALGLSKVEDQTKRVAVAEKLFGKAGLGFIRVALGGAAALRKQREEFEELLGGGTYEQFVDDSKEAAIANDRLRNTTQALRVTIARRLIPTLTKVVRFFARAAISASKLINKMVEFAKGTEIVRVSLAALATVAIALAAKVLAAYAAPIAVFVLWAASIAFVILLIEDFFVLLTGGESLIGRFLDKLLGVGTAQHVVDSIVSAFEEMGTALELGLDLAGAFAGKLKEGLQEILPVLRQIGGKVLDILESVGLGPEEEITETEAEFEGRLGRQLAASEGAKSQSSGTRAIAQLVGKGGKVLSEERTRGIQAELDARARARAERNKTAAQIELESLGASLQADIRGPSAQSSSVIVNQGGTTINVTGAGDPTTVARAVNDERDRREQDTLRRAREELAAR